MNHIVPTAVTVKVKSTHRTTPFAMAIRGRSAKGEERSPKCKNRQAAEFAKKIQAPRYEPINPTCDRAKPRTWTPDLGSLGDLAVKFPWGDRLESKNRADRQHCLAKSVEIRQRDRKL